MKKIPKITALLCALVLSASSLGTYTDNARAAGLPVTSDDAGPLQETMGRSAANTGAKTNVQKLEPGKKVQGRLVSGDDGQRYQVTLKSSGQLDIHLEGTAGKLAGRLTDKNGKGWAPRRRTADGKQTYQLKKGTYYYQVQIAKGAQIPETGLDYAVTAKFKSAKAKFEDNNTWKKAAKAPLDREFYGHLAQNSPTEYYKFTLKRMSQLSFSINTQVADQTPETFVVTLYNKYGKRMTDGWENPDWRKEFDGEWKTDWENFGSELGMLNLLPAGTYYVGVSIKRDENGKVPASARYGNYKIYARVKPAGVSVELSHKQAEYTGKEIKPPKITLKKHFKKAYYSDWYHDKEGGYTLDALMRGIGESMMGPIKDIGRYRITQNCWSPPHGTWFDDTYAIFTVTPTRGKISRVSSKQKGQVQVSIKKNAQSTGYQIQIARDKKFRKARRTWKATNLKETLKGLTPGKRYYVRVRNYKDVTTNYFGNTLVPESIYGKWSKVRTVVCK